MEQVDTFSLALSLDFGPWTRRTVKGIYRPVLLPNIIVGANFHVRAQTAVKDMEPRLFGSRHDTAFTFFQGSSNGHEENETR